MKHLKTFEKFYDVATDKNITRAGQIIGKSLTSANAIIEITDFVEANIQNKEIEKEIDELTTIKRSLKSALNESVEDETQKVKIVSNIMDDKEHPIQTLDLTIGDIYDVVRIEKPNTVNVIDDKGWEVCLIKNMYR